VGRNKSEFTVDLMPRALGMRSKARMLSWLNDTSNATPGGIVVRFSIDAHADIGIDMPHQIVAVLHETFDEV